MVRQKAARHTNAAYPDLTKAWTANAARVRDGLPPLPLPEVPASVMNPYSVKVRERRKLERRRKAYDQAQAEKSAQPVKDGTAGSGRKSERAVEKSASAPEPQAPGITVVRR